MKFYRFMELNYGQLIQPTPYFDASGDIMYLTDYKSEDAAMDAYREVRKYNPHMGELILVSVIK